MPSELFQIKIKQSQSHYVLQKKKNIQTNDQCSYNLKKGLKDRLLQVAAINCYGNGPKNDLHTIYKLSGDWSLYLDESIIRIIGEKYRNMENEIIFVSTIDRNGLTPKFQLIRSYFKAENSDNYNWFVELYNSNYMGAEFVVSIDIDTKILTISNNFLLNDIIEERIESSDFSPIDNDSYTSMDGYNEIPRTIIKGGINEIYYGSPGCGKSHLVMQKYSVNDNIVIRTTFYPDYTNSDFVGQIMPRIDNDSQIFYEFVPGVFTIALLKSLSNSDKRVVLIIEEVNRGNASAVFGEMFQLLDRDRDGQSIYTIDNPILLDYINKNLEEKIGKIYLPSNLSIVATMNTSDQNIIPLDTAFKRRWNLIKVKNIFSDQNILANFFVPRTNVTWKTFVEKINGYLIENAQQLSLFGEDKCLGVYFVSERELSLTEDDETPDGEVANRLFSEKVLFYLWNDVARLAPSKWFKPQYRSFDQLLIGFENEGVSVFVGGIFE